MLQHIFQLHIRTTVVGVVGESIGIMFTNPASDKIKHLYLRSKKEAALILAASVLKVYIQMSLLCILILLS